jgi:hypothetical protein
MTGTITVLSENMSSALEHSSELSYIRCCIERRADALANLPTRARWYLPQGGGCGRKTGNQAGSKRRLEASALLG